MNKKLFFSVLFFIFLGLIGYGYFQSTPQVKNQEGKVPQIEVTPNFFDFGKADYGEVLKHTFEVKNKGDKVLEIKTVATSCPCTTAKIKKEKINPGKEAELLVRYDTGAMPETHGKGKQERIIYIKSNDPVNPQAEVEIEAYVQ